MSRPSYVASRHNQHTGLGQVRGDGEGNDDDDNDNDKRETASGRNIECVVALKSMQ